MPRTRSMRSTPSPEPEPTSRRRRGKKRTVDVTENEGAEPSTSSTSVETTDVAVRQKLRKRSARECASSSESQTDGQDKPPETETLTPVHKPKALHGEEYRRRLYTTQANTEGLLFLCNLINDRCKKIIRKYKISPDELKSGTLSAKLNEIATSPSIHLHGKFGLQVQKETLTKFESVLSDIEIVEEQERAMRDNLQDEGAELESELTSEIVNETLEGIDRDLLGVNSQQALDKLSNLMDRTLKENHFGGINAADDTESIAESVANVPEVPPGRKAPPLKFAFLSVVATYDAKCRVNLEELHRRVRCANFDPMYFHSVTITLPASECRAAIFENGKFVITGVTTIKMALVATRNVLEILQMCGYQPEINKKNFRAKNLTAMMDLGVNLDIAGFAEKNPGNTYMDQDTFSAVTHLPEKGMKAVPRGTLGMCFLIFATGKIIMVGGKTEKHMITVFRDHTLALLKPFSFGHL